MIAELNIHASTILAMLSVAALLLVQIVVVDLAGLKSRHKPGTPVDVDPQSFLFRAYRAHANTNETIAIFILLACAGVLSGAPPHWLAYSAWAYVGCRVTHMVAYYMNAGLLRSIAFALSLGALTGMLVATGLGLRG